MATLNEVMKDTADAIREKTGKSELIAPVDFASEIKGITVGGESGGGTMEYLDVSGFPAEVVGSLFVPFSILARGMSNTGRVFVMPSATAIGAIDNITIEAVAVGFSLQVIEMGTIGTIKDIFIAQGITQADFDSIPRITKEQFYTLD